jgi:hypothetical protein
MLGFKIVGLIGFKTWTRGWYVRIIFLLLLRKRRKNPIQQTAQRGARGEATRKKKGGRPEVRWMKRINDVVLERVVEGGQQMDGEKWR